MGRPTVTREHVQEAARRINSFGVVNGAVPDDEKVVTFRPTEEAGAALGELLGIHANAVGEINAIAAACESGGATADQGFDAGFMIAMWATLIAQEDAAPQSPAKVPKTPGLGAAYPHVRYDDLREAWTRVNDLTQIHHGTLPPQVAHTVCAFWGIDVDAFKRLADWLEGTEIEVEARAAAVFWLLTGVFAARLAAGINDE